MFIEYPASKASLAQRKLTFGVGVNDAKYNLSVFVAGKKFTCPYYSVWSQMLKRCYSTCFHIDCPTYVDCKSCPEWLMFSTFKKWMEAQNWRGNELDKDLIVKGNKIYSPETCIFVDRKVNCILNENGNASSSTAIGAVYIKKSGRFRAVCNDGNKRKLSLGCYSTEAQAHAAYCIRKAMIVRQVASEQPSRVKLLLSRIADEIETGTYFTN